jgi:lysophospholipase L1-like esterase
MKLLAANVKSGLVPGTIGNLTEISYANDNFISGDGHPSELGHEKIAEELYNWIDNPVNPAPKF